MSNYTTTSYYKSSGPPSGMPRGRGGYSSGPGPVRGAPRGRGSSDSWTPRGRGRGGYNSYQSRGGGGMSSGSSGTGQWYNKDHQSQPSYRSNADRYQSSGSRPNESRYPSTRGGSSVDYNRRYSQRDGPQSYSSGREHHRSPDPLPRKRLRTDSYSPASSRRSHDGGYEYSSSTRYEYGSDKGSYNSEDRGRPMYREERRPSADRRDDFHSPRSRELSGSTMPPPSGPVRGSYRSRGATVRGRGVTRVFTRRPTDVSLAARKTRLIEAYAAKRRILTGRSQDYYKKLKSIKLRR
ncbi:Eukaryotic translation initiation factor 3 subunit A [Frankliniella fusca]|uniref:Eukaryotic translation initiation factor 3 subunit A n=1 Tax=Frankliniella fusca TaxID=407009 RepID=A0AAE1GQJ0_9NEOP|nr:Eukaryotic translation initiation factor 3 subunit A [Frankliniella fusca]